MNKLVNCYFSELVGASLFSHDKKIIGTIKDIFVQRNKNDMSIIGAAVKTSKGMVNIGVTGLTIYKEKAIKAIVDNYDDMEILEDRTARLSDILDKQIFDKDGIKIVRVNDLILSNVKNEYKVSYIDISINALLRRLGIGKLNEFILNLVKIQANNDRNLISVDKINSLEENIGHIVLSSSWGNIKYASSGKNQMVIQNNKSFALKKVV